MGRGQTARRWAYVERLQHSKGVDPAPRAAPPWWRDADLRQNPDGKNHHFGCRAQRHDPEREDEDSGQGGYSARAAASDLCGQTARGRAYSVGLQHPKGVYPALGAAPARRKLMRMKASTLLLVYFRIISEEQPFCVIVLVQHFALLISFH